MGAEAMKMALIGVAFRNAEMITHIKNHDMVNGMLVPHLKDCYGATPKDRWDLRANCDTAKTLVSQRVHTCKLKFLTTTKARTSVVIRS